MRPFLPETLMSVVLMAVVGAMQAFRVLLIKPIVDNVLSPAASPDKVLVFTIPRTAVHVDLQRWLPRSFHNAWTVVALALIASALVKAVCDYTGTILANRAGFGMITDLRNDLYDSLLQRSASFFLPAYLEAAGLPTLVISVTESGLITIMIGWPVLSLARTRNELGIT